MKVLNFGSLNCDHVYTMPHIASIGETVSSLDYIVNCGGKGFNQSIALKKAGVNVYHAGTIGNDGIVLLNKLREYGCDIRYINTIDAPTGHAIIQVSENGDNCIVLYGGANMCQSIQFIDSVLNDFGAGDILVLQNEINNISSIIDKAYDKNMSIALNPSPCNEKISDYDLSKVSMLFVNEVEGYQLTGKSDPKNIADSILVKYPEIKIILTLGSNGSVYADKSNYISQPAIPSDVKDTTAAGDTFMGYFIAGMIQSLSPKQALELAAKASAVTISKIGAADTIPYYSEI